MLRMQLFLRRVSVLGSNVLEINCLSASEQHVLQPIDCIKSLATTQNEKHFTVHNPRCLFIML